MESKCTECNSQYKEFDLNPWENSISFQVPYCPKCGYTPEINIPQFKAISGKAQRGINKSTGEFRLKVTHPEDFKKEIMVQTYHGYRVTKPSEWRYSKRKGLYKTKSRLAKVYPELKKNDIVYVVGLWEEGIPLLSAVIHNETVGITTTFLYAEYTVKKGFFGKLTLTNPILSKSYDMLSDLMDTQVH